jgi:anti-sigma factor RsiW
VTLPPRLTDQTLNAYVDGQLPARAEREVALALEKDAAAAARVAAWRRQGDALRAALTPIADEPLPLSLILKVRASLPERSWTRTAWIAGASFAAGMAAGVLLAWVISATLN